MAQRTKKKSWNALVRSAELNVDLLAALWPQHSEATQAQLLNLMAKFGLIVPQRQQSVFLVPALLTDSEDKVESLFRMAKAAGSPADVQYTAYFVFSLQDQLEDTQALDILTLRTDGFLPTGFFPRVLGKCVSWAQRTHGAPAQLTQGTAIISFGGDRFMLNELPEWNAIRIVLLQDLSLIHI